MDFNLDNLFILILIGGFLIRVLTKKKKSQEAIGELVTDEMEEENNIFSDINEKSVYDESVVSTEASQKYMVNNMSSEIHKESPLTEKIKNTIEKTHHAEKKDIEQFDLREAVIMSTILERKYV